MKTRRFRLPALSVLAFAATLTLGAAAITALPAAAQPAVGTGPVRVTLRISGLPAAMRPQVFLVQPAIGGGYVKVADLGTADGRTYNVEPDAVLEVGPIYLSRDTALYPNPRFRSVSALEQTPQTFEVRFVRQYLLTVSKWSNGPAPSEAFGQVQGDVSLDSQWVDENTVLEAVATPRPGWRFAHWGVFVGSEAQDETRVTSTSSRLRIQMDKPLTIVAGFVCRQRLNCVPLTVVER